MSATVVAAVDNAVAARLYSTTLIAHIAIMNAGSTVSTANDTIATAARAARGFLIAMKQKAPEMRRELQRRLLLT